MYFTQLSMDGKVKKYKINSRFIAPKGQRFGLTNLLSILLNVENCLYTIHRENNKREESRYLGD